MALSEILEVLANQDAPYTSSDVCTLAGCSYRQLDYWCRTGLITAARLNNIGSGHQREWEVESVIEVIIISRLARAGVDVGRLREIDVIEFAESLINDLRDVVEIAGIIHDAVEDEDDHPITLGHLGAAIVALKELVPKG